MLLFLLCFIVVSFSHAGETSLLLPQKNCGMQIATDNIKNQELCNKVKKTYYSKNSINGFCSYEVKKIFFYSPVKKEVFSFEPIASITDLFNEKNKLIFDILLSEKMNNFVSTNEINKELFDKFMYFFKQLHNWYIYARIPEEMRQNRWIYNLNHFFYTITSSKNVSDQKNIYHHFFTCFQKEAASLYNDIAEERKHELFVGNVIGAAISGVFILFTAISTGFTFQSLESSTGAIPSLVGAVSAPVITFSVKTTIYFINYFGYQKFLKSIENLNQELGVKGV